VLGHELRRDRTGLSKLVPEVLGITLDKAMEVEPRLQELCYDRRGPAHPTELFDIARSLEGLNRSAGMHAAGVVIGDKPLWEYVPVFGPANAATSSPSSPRTRSRRRGPREVRLPRAQDADGDRHAVRIINPRPRPAAGPARHRQAPARRRRRSTSSSAGRHRRACSSSSRAASRSSSRSCKPDCSRTSSPRWRSTARAR
jgi:hypothetical protein